MPYGQSVGAVSGAIAQATPLAHRSAVVAADVVAVPGTVTCTKQAGGSLTANTYLIKVVAINAQGRTTPKAGNVSVVTETTNLTMRAAFAAVTGATAYDIYCSTDADPKWVGQITAAQLASGIKITAVGTTGAGSIAGAVDVEVPGTGLQGLTTAAVSTAYVIPSTGTVIDCSGYQYCDFEITASRTGDAVALAVNLIVMVQNARTGVYSMSVTAPIALTFGGTAGNYQSLVQRYHATVSGSAAVWCLVESIAGTGASLTIDAIPN
jgi:hypothetical protein